MTISSMPIEENHYSLCSKEQKTKDSKFTANYYTQSL